MKAFIAAIACALFALLLLPSGPALGDTGGPLAVTETPLPAPTRVIQPTRAPVPTATPRVNAPKPGRRVCKWRCIKGRWCLICTMTKARR
jgi:hypothetical protein